jgi:hypothetical protein
MKTGYKITLIAFFVLVVAYGSVITYALGPEDVLNPAGIIYFPSIAMQLAANEGNGIICVDACGPCSAWGHNYLLVDGECKIPDNVEDCYYISPPLNWKFIDGECMPVDEAGNLFDDKSCKDGEVELMPNACFLLIDVVFGNHHKKGEQDWKIYPGGAGWRLPENSTLTPIYKEVKFGMMPLDFDAMLNDKIFVDKCKSHGGTWNAKYADCEGIWETCSAVGGIRISRDVTPECTGDACLDAKLIRNSCVFPYEN